MSGGRKIWRSVLRVARTAIRPDVNVTTLPDDIHVDWNLPVAVRDGTILRINVFRPKIAGRFPVIMSAHPYGKDKMPAKTRNGRGLNLQYRLIPQPRALTISQWTSWEAPDPVVWVTRGYVVINADLRGAGTSEGEGELFSDQEALDYYDLIEWAAVQSWSSGRVGLDGVSYLAICQYKVAALRPPHLAAICPWEGLSDLYRDFAYPGGVREDGFSILWSKATSRQARLGTPIRRQIAKRPQRDAWFASVTPDLERIEVPILVCASFSDHCLHTRGSFEVFRRAGSRRKWLYTHRGGKWSEYYGTDATATRIRFFDHTLKALDNGWADEPAVRLAIAQAGPEPAAVVHEQAWPPADLIWRKLWLDASLETMIDGPAPVAATSRSFEVRRGVVWFVWTVPGDMDVIGPMALHLSIEMHRSDDVFLFAGVRKFRSGIEATFEGSYGFSGDMVSKGWQRGAHRWLDDDLSTPEQPVYRHDHAEPLRPGEIVPIGIAMRPHATRLCKGDELRLQISGKWHYAKDPIRGQFPSGYRRSPGGSCTLHTGGLHNAHLLIGTRAITDGL